MQLEAWAKQAAFPFVEAGATGTLFVDLDEAEARSAAEGSKEYDMNPYYRAVALKLDIFDLV